MTQTSTHRQVPCPQQARLRLRELLLKSPRHPPRRRHLRVNADMFNNSQCFKLRRCKALKNLDYSLHLALLLEDRSSVHRPFLSLPQAMSQQSALAFAS